MSAGQKKSLALVHTVTGLIPIFEGLIHRHLPDWRPFNIVDESLLRNAIRDEGAAPAIARRVAGYVWSVIDGGADAILVTCSSIGPAVDAARLFCPVPLVRVLATLSTTREPTRHLVLRRAKAVGRAPTIVARLCVGAFEALSKGDRVAHDTAIFSGLKDLATEVEVILLAQASLARVLEGTDVHAIGIPVLTSPELGVRNLEYLGSCRTWESSVVSRRQERCQRRLSNPT